MRGPTDTVNSEKQQYFNSPPTDYILIKQTKPEWRFKFGANSNFSFHSTTAPNAFNRLMQKLILGIHWEKSND
jgi:hypothetical protein